MPVCSEIALADMAAEGPGLPARGRGTGWSVWAGRSNQQVGSTPSCPQTIKLDLGFSQKKDGRPDSRGWKVSPKQQHCHQHKSRPRGEEIIKNIKVAPDTVVSSHNSPYLGGRGGRITRSRPSWAI